MRTSFKTEPEYSVGFGPNRSNSCLSLHWEFQQLVLFRLAEMLNSLLANGAAGAASDIDGQADRPNGAFGESDVEGKTAREAASELARSEFQTSGSE
jgi:hypothetical protein